MWVPHKTNNKIQNISKYNIDGYMEVTRFDAKLVNSNSMIAQNMLPVRPNIYKQYE